MEGFFEALGTIGLVLLVVTGALAGLIASVVTGGRDKLLYIGIGVIGAVVLPFLLATLGVGLLAAGGIAAILAAALVGAVCVLVIAKLVIR